MAQGTSVGLPHSSPLMKLASRPRKMPIVPAAQVRSPSERMGMPRWRANSTTASTQPRKPPWKDMPPFHNSIISKRVLREIVRIVEQHITDAAAQDDAERDPEHEVVEVGRGHRRHAAPKRLVLDHGAGIEPTQQYAYDIGERVPANGERPEADEHRVEGGKGNDIKRHRRFPARRKGDAGSPTQKSSWRRRAGFVAL